MEVLGGACMGGKQVYRLARSHTQLVEGSADR